MAEAYKKGDIVAIVHFRENGQVCGHTQREGARLISYAYLFRMGEADFAECVKSAEVYDARRLPALYEEKSGSTYLN